MQLKIQRSQRTGGVVRQAIVFCLDARIFLTPEEQSSVSRYRLGGEVIYNSQASRKHLDKADELGRQGSYLKSIASTALAAMNLNITIDSLERGQHIECKDLNELLSAEEAIMEACERMRDFLQAASTFDGREVVIDFSQQEPVAVSKTVALAVTPPSMSNVSAPPILMSSPVPPAPGYQHAGGSSYAANTNLPPVRELWGNLNQEWQFYVALGSALLLLIIMYFVF